MHARLLRVLQRYVRHRCFPVLVALVGFADMFVFVLPNDLLLLSETAASPHRRRSSVLIVSFGSALGAAVLAFALQKGVSAILYLHPQAAVPGFWQHTKVYFERYGTWALFLAALGPIPVQPFVAGAVFSRMASWNIFAVVLAGRLVKYSILAFIPSLLPWRRVEVLPPQRSQ